MASSKATVFNRLLCEDALMEMTRDVMKVARSCSPYFPLTNTFESTECRLSVLLDDVTGMLSVLVTGTRGGTGGAGGGGGAGRPF